MSILFSKNRFNKQLQQGCQMLIRQYKLKTLGICIRKHAYSCLRANENRLTVVDFLISYFSQIISMIHLFQKLHQNF